jgi:hypothetical protein
MALGGGRYPSSSLACYRLAPLANERINAMSEVTLVQEEEILSFDVSDEALETAAAGKENAFTLGACSGLSVCPG